MQVQSTKSFSSNQIKILVIGSSGDGKTFLASTTEDHSRTLVINAENGLLTLHDFDIPVIDISQEEPAENKIKKLVEIYQYLKTDEAQEKYDWIFIDSLTEISQILVQGLKTKYPDKKDGLNLWGEYAEKIVNLIKSFRDLKGYHVVMTSLQAMDKDEHQRMFFGVDMNGKVSQRCPAFFDEVFTLRAFETEEGEFKRALQTQPFDGYLAKDRSGKLDRFEPCNLAAVKAKMLGE
jgi:hypothetical protein